MLGLGLRVTHTTGNTSDGSTGTGTSDKEGNVLAGEVGGLERVLNLGVGAKVVGKGVVGVRVLVENHTAGDRVAEVLGNADVAVGRVKATGSSATHSVSGPAVVASVSWVQNRAQFRLNSQ